MYIRSRITSLVYKSLLVLVCAYGLYLNLGFTTGGFNVLALRYYTILSNLLCLLVYIAAVFYCIVRIVKKGAEGAIVFSPTLKGAVLMCITVTLLIYQFLLAETPFSMDASSVPLANTLVHLVVPLMVIVDWLLFDRKGTFRFSDPFYWLTLPLLYYVFVLLGVQLGFTYGKGENISRFPYPFIDIDRLGWEKVFMNVGILLAAFLVIAFLIVGLDKLMGKISKIKHPPEIALGGVPVANKTVEATETPTVETVIDAEAKAVEQAKTDAFLATMLPTNENGNTTPNIPQ